MMHMVPLSQGTEKGFGYGFKRKVVQSISQPSRVAREQRSTSTYLIVVIICTGCINNALAKPFDNLDLTSKVLERGGKYVSRYVYDVQGGDQGGYEYDGEMTPESFGGSAQEDILPLIGENNHQGLGEAPQSSNEMNKRKFEEFDYPSRTGKTGLVGLKPPRGPPRSTVTVTRRSPYDEEEPEQLDNYLSSFYLIKTPYGYALGRRDPEGYLNYVRRRAIRGRPGKRSYQGSSKRSKFSWKL